MPNWTSNRLYFKPDAALQSKADVLEALHNTGFSELYAHGVHTARALFLLVFSGVIRVRPQLYGLPPLRWMSKFGGARVTLDLPVDDDVSLLIERCNGVADTNTLTRLVAYATVNDWFTQTTVLSELAELHQECWTRASELFNEVWYDYSESLTSQTTFNDWVTYYSNPRLATPELIPDTGYHDMRELVPMQLLPELNGFNGRFARGGRNANAHWNTLAELLGIIRGVVPSAYAANCELYGTKWPGFEFSVGVENDLVYVDFNTAWSPPSNHWLEALSKQYPAFTESYWSEASLRQCGSTVVLEPGLVLERGGPLQITESKDNTDCSVTGPDWILNKVGHYGG